MAGKRARSASTISAVSSTESVVWVTKARRPGSRGAMPRHVGDGLDQHHLARRAAGPWCRPPPDGRRGRSARSAGRPRSGARPRHGPWRPAGRWRRGRACARASASAGTALGTPWAEKTTGRSGGHSSSSSTKTAPWRLQAVDHMAVVDDLVAHIDRRAVLLDRPLDDLDRPVDAGAEAARGGEVEGQGARASGWSRRSVWRSVAPHYTGGRGRLQRERRAVNRRSRPSAGRQRRRSTRSRASVGSRRRSRFAAWVGAVTK